MQYDAGAVFRSPHLERGEDFPVRHPRATQENALGEVATILGDYLAALYPAYTLPQESHIMVATSDWEIAEAVRQLDKDTDVCPIVGLQVEKDDSSQAYIVGFSTFQGTVAVFTVPYPRAGRKARLPRKLVILCSQVVVLGWDVNQSLASLGVGTVKAAVATGELDQMCITHARFPYKIPRDLPYDHYLINQLVYGHHFGAQSKTHYRIRAQHLQPLVAWHPSRDPHILFDWDLPFNAEQLGFLYNKCMSPFVTLALYTMLNLAGNQIHPKQENSVQRLLHTGLALSLVRLDIELSADSDQSERGFKRTRKRKPAVVTGSNAIPINTSYSYSSANMSTGKPAKTPCKQGELGNLPSRDQSRTLTLDELEGGLRAAAAQYIGNDLVEKLVVALKVERAQDGSGSGKVETGVREVAVKYLGIELVRELEQALKNAQPRKPESGSDPNPPEAAARRLANLTMGSYPTVEGVAAADRASGSGPETMSWADQSEAAEAGAAQDTKVSGELPEGARSEGEHSQPEQGEIDGAAALAMPYRNIRQTPPRLLADGQKSKEKIKRPIKTSGYEIPYRYRELVPWETACARCGSEHHVGCSRRVHPCAYPLCRGPPQAHAITSCPQLHMLCDLCRSRGHDRDQCLERDRLDLAEIFRKFAHDGRFTRRGVRAKAPIKDWDFEGPKKEIDELNEIHLLEKVVLVDWGSEELDEYANRDINGKYWQLEREILK